MRIESEPKYKIGIAKNPEKRIKQLQTGSYDNIILCKKVHTGKLSRKIESALHNFWKYNRLSGEWFDLSFKEEMEFEQTVIKQKLLFESIKDNYFINKKTF